jgi:hypothetical protein
MQLTDELELHRPILAASLRASAWQPACSAPLDEVSIN